MDNDALAQIQQRLAELPADVRNAVQAADLDQKVQALGARHQLHVDQIGELGDETMMAMLGFTPLETFGKRLATALSLAPDAGEQLAQDVSAEIFDSIRDSMKKFAAAKAAPPAPPQATQDAVPLPSVALAKEGPQKAPLNPQLAQANVVLSQKTVSVAPPAAKPAEKPIYKADPYREQV